MDSYSDYRTLETAALLIVTYLLLRSRWAKGLQVFQTIWHEGGHGLAAVLTGGRVVGIEIHEDTSGLCRSQHFNGSKIARILTIVSGYGFPPVAAVVYAWVASIDSRLACVLWSGLLTFIVAKTYLGGQIFGFTVVLAWLALNFVLLFNADSFWTGFAIRFQAALLAVTSLHAAYLHAISQGSPSDDSSKLAASIGICSSKIRGAFYLWAAVGVFGTFWCLSAQ